MKLNTQIVWVPVAERLPDDELTVLVATEAGEVGQGALDADQWRWSDPGVLIVTDVVTHWAELPLHPHEIPQDPAELLADRVAAPVVGDQFIKGGSTATVVEVKPDEVVLEFRDSSENDRKQSFKLDEFAKCALRTIARGGVFEPAKTI